MNLFTKQKQTYRYRKQMYSYQRGSMGLMGIIQDGGVEGRTTPKLQLIAEQPLTGECWIPPKKIPHIQGQRKSPNKAVGRQNHV